MRNGESGIGRVVILVIAHKPVISTWEAVSLRQLFNVLGRYPIRLISPEGLSMDCYRRIVPDIEVDYIPPAWQSSRAGFEMLKVEPFLYRRYEEYEFVLFYELDAFVFRDELESWCDKNHDYIGAPWFEGYSIASETAPFIGVGNGGFSLRKIESLLRARTRLPLSSCIALSEGRLGSTKRRVLTRKGLTIAQHLACSWLPSYSPYLRSGPEDHFWGVQIKREFSWFKVAGIEDAMRFSFEVLPRRLYSLNGGQLPFGCHGWFRYDLPFWRPFIESFGYSLGQQPALAATDRT